MWWGRTANCGWDYVPQGEALQAMLLACCHCLHIDHMTWELGRGSVGIRLGVGPSRRELGRDELGHSRSWAGAGRELELGGELGELGSRKVATRKLIIILEDDNNKTLKLSDVSL